MFAVIKTGGKQYRVEQGDVLEIVDPPVEHQRRGQQPDEAGRGEAGAVVGEACGERGGGEQPAANQEHQGQQRHGAPQVEVEQDDVDEQHDHLH